MDLDSTLGEIGDLIAGDGETTPGE